ncbi:YqeB family protein [Virgibacillus sp. FSP13]
MTESKLSLNHEKTVVGYSKTTGILLYGGFGALGLILGYFLPKIAAWALTLPWIPFEGIIKIVNSFDGFWLSIILAVIGLIAGLVLASIAISELLIITITDREVHLKKNEIAQTIALKDIDTIFFDGKQLVILGKSGYELFRETSDESSTKVMSAFKRYGYPCSDEDPFKNEYRRWVLDTPDVSPSANALLKAREIALQKKEEKEIKDLRTELAKLGYIIRDEETRQYWREVPSK